MRADETRLLVEKSKEQIPPMEERVLKNITNQVRICAVNRLNKFTKNLGYFLTDEIREYLWMYSNDNCFQERIAEYLRRLGYEVTFTDNPAFIDNSRYFPDITVGW